MSDNVEVSQEYLIKDVTICTDRLIGSGSYAVVYLATYHGTKVAAKKLHSIFFEGVDPQEYKGILQSWLNEFKLMQSLRHPNIVQFYGVFNSNNPSSMLLSGNSYIITELLAKSLQARNSEEPRLTIRHIINIAMDIAAGLCYLHNRPNPIMHRDLASKNVLLSALGQAKIADLGVAKLTTQMQQSHTRHPGTDYYMPLETMVDGDSYDHSIDVYALGVIILEMAIGKNPTATQSLKRVGNRFEVVPEIERRINDINELQESSNAVLEKIIMRCLQEKEYRISASEVTMHLDRLKASEEYQSCKETSVFEIKKKMESSFSSHEHQHKMKEHQNELEDLKSKIKNLEIELEGLKNKIENLKKENDDLKKEIGNQKNKIGHEEKINKVEQDVQNKLQLQGSKGNFERPYASKSIMPPPQQTSQYVTSGSQLPQKMTTSSSSMVVPKQYPLSTHLPSNSTYSSMEKPHIQSLSYSVGQPPRSLHDLDQNPKSLHGFNPPPQSLHQPPQSLHQPPQSLHQPPQSFHQPLRPVRSIDRPPIPSYAYKDQSPRSSYNSYQPPQSLHQPPQSLYCQRSESWSSDTSDTPTSDYHDSIDTDFSSSSSQLDNNFTSLPARLSNDPAIQKNREYLTYQLSCMDRVMGQLMSVNYNTSENLVTSFVETLKEQILRTADYVRKLPHHVKVDQYIHEPLQHMSHMLSNARFDRISYRYTQDLNTAIRNLQDTLSKYTHVQ